MISVFIERSVGFMSGFVVAIIPMSFSKLFIRPDINLRNSAVPGLFFRELTCSMISGAATDLSCSTAIDTVSSLNPPKTL